MTATAAPSRPSGKFIAAAALGGVLLLDAAIETLVAGSPVRWWVVGAALLYTAATASFWRLRVGWSGQLALAVFGVLGLVAATAWAPAGLIEGVRLLGQPTARVLAACAAAGVALAGFAIARSGRLPLAARIVAAALAAYGAVAFAVGALEGATLPAMFSGHSLWQRLPAVLQGAFVGAFIVLPIGLVWAIATAGLRRPPETSWRADLWKIAALVTSFAIVLAGTPLRPGGGSAVTSAGNAAPPETFAALAGIDPNAPPATPEAINTALANSLRAVADGDQQISRDRWDPAYVASHLGFNTDREFAWVQQNTFWIPYKGVLRGPVGVLMDRLGNSLDRSVLLATLLGQAGRTVRLAHATLPRDRATALVVARYHARSSSARRATAASPDPIARVATHYQLDEAAVRRTFAAQLASRTRQRAALLQRVPDQAARLAAAVGPASTTASILNLEHALDAAADHWWTQVFESGVWRDLDLAGGPSGAALASPDRTMDPGSLPADLRHQITIRVVTEQWANGALTERTAIEHALRPADLIGTPVVLQFSPAEWPTAFPPANMDAAQGLRQVALDQHGWTLTLLTGQTAAAQMDVKDTGDVAPPAGKSPGGAFSTFGHALDDALGTSSPPAAPKTPAPADKVLTSAWIEYEIQTPGEQPQKIRRAVFDVIGPAGRATRPVARPQIDDAARLRRSLSLMMQTEILPMVCRFVPQFVTHLGARSLLANKDLLTSAVRGDLPDDFAHAQELAGKLAPLPSALYGLALARFTWSRQPRSIFIDRTNILTRHMFFAPAGSSAKLLVATDVVANQIGVDPAVTDPFALRLEQGVLDTNAEALLMTERPTASNAGWAYAASSSGWATLRSVNDPQLASLKLPDDTRRRIGEDLAAGYVVVAPNAPVAVGTDAFSGWWRIDPRTGQSLGMGGSGWGQDMVEYVIIAATAFGLGFLFQYMWCRISGAGGAPAVANACEPGRPGPRPSPMDRLVTPVYAIGSACFQQALFAGFLSALLGPLMAAGAGAGGGPPGEPVEGPGVGDPVRIRTATRRRAIRSAAPSRAIQGEGHLRVSRHPAVGDRLRASRRPGRPVGSILAPGNPTRSGSRPCRG